ncbi:hypothetical protein ACP26L_07105 [Paenibacillus sp. S-38]|uniref:hypothetical protein n=1 Tax=Paenibacillus sp. S-38 TaxID=3416710 RepID=UPI003CFA8B01
MTNLAVDLAYGRGLTVLLDKLSARENGTVTPLSNLALMTGIALILYAYQKWQEGDLLPAKPKMPRKTAGLEQRLGIRVLSKSKRIKAKT